MYIYTYRGGRGWLSQISLNWLQQTNGLAVLHMNIRFSKENYPS